MRYVSIIAMLCLVCSAIPAQASNDVVVSYTEDYPPGRALALTHGIWDCGSAGETKVARTMVDMARHPTSQHAIGAGIGCTRTLDPDRMEAPWKVVREIATLCEERSRERDEIVLPDGRRQMQTYELCGLEAHALLIERNGERRTAIDVIDPASFN